MTVITRYLPERNVVQIEIRDTGPGIAADQMDKLFSPFVSTKKSRGTGLGLPVSQKILTEHGGKISVESLPGQGACFHVGTARREPDDDDADHFRDPPIRVKPTAAENIPEFRANLFPTADVYKVRHHLTFFGVGVKLEVGACGKIRFPCCTGSPTIRALVAFLPSQPAHRAWKGFAMGATTKSISGLFANVCGRNRLRSQCPRTYCSRPRDPFGGRPGLSVPFPLLA